MSRRGLLQACSAAVLLVTVLAPCRGAHAAAPSPVASPRAAFPVHVRALAALDTHQQPVARFHRGDPIGLRIRWQVLRARAGEHEVVIWVVYAGHKAVYRHYRTALARVGRWRWTTSVRIPRTASPGIYTFEGKVVLGRKASWRVLTFRVVP
ncbi:MAG: hypothetical protein NVSMB65_17230 [Chloroflexota bacterium]